ncbi:DUF1572 family protein [Flammeovirga sp. SJP92]|uniref:DUF1572 family protein n=1 Tax=Flammeovirga sp. SJP92 TaxID=1775430 RepID=UPI000787C03B|nr:DUF1572 family protein [Flammeovirga sp. SJP92]KXX68973.1 hypothetical protein AVL50_17585 [Flammeovirga sp. SJP92]
MKNEFIISIRKQFEYYKFLGEQCFNQLNEKELFWQYNEDSNAISTIVNHLSGNMKSRWTDFLTSDGEKEWRNRDQEFESTIKSKEELFIQWEEGWECLFTAIDSIDENNFETKVFIRNQEHTIIDAFHRQLAHYSYHIGQIVFVGKMIKGRDWKSLSIPKGKSLEFNETKFSKGKHKGHFTDDLKK